MSHTRAVTWLSESGLEAANSNHLLHGDHLSGKPGNVGEFASCQENVGDFTESQGNVREKSC